MQYGANFDMNAKNNYVKNSARISVENSLMALEKKVNYANPYLDAQFAHQHGAMIAYANWMNTLSSLCVVLVPFEIIRKDFNGWNEYL